MEVCRFRKITLGIGEIGRGEVAAEKVGTEPDDIVQIVVRHGVKSLFGFLYSGLSKPVGLPGQGGLEVHAP